MEAAFNNNPVYSGEFRHAIDVKNRITVPSRWRRSELEEFYVMPEQHGRFLVAMPLEEFRRVGQSVTDNPNITPEKKRKFFRKFYSQAQAVSVDRQGRMLLPDEYCRQVNLGAEVLLAGVSQRFEIWNPDLWRTTLQQEQDDYCEVADTTGL